MNATQFEAMMDLLRQTLTAAVQGAARPAALDPQLLRPTKMTAEDRPEAYLEVFEAMATLAGWAPADWARCLLPQLTGEAQAAARTLSPEAMMNYPTLKAVILNRVGATPEGYRKKFRGEQFAAGEHPRAIAHRLKDYALGWLNPDVNTKARLVEMVVVERFLECLAPGPRLWVQRQAPDTLDWAVELAEQYQAAEPTPARLPGRSMAAGLSPQLAPERVKGLGGRGYQGFGRGVSAGAPGPGTGAGWGYPRAAAVSDRGLARTPYRRATVLAPVFPPVAEASGRETSSPRCWTCREVGHLARDCPAMECDLGRPGKHVQLPQSLQHTGFVIPVTVDGTKTQALLDSGCGQSLVQESLISPGHKPILGRVHIKCIHGDVRSYPKIKVNMIIGQQVTQVQVGLCPRLPVPVVLGRDCEQFKDWLTALTAPSHSNRINGDTIINDGKCPSLCT
ncbi:UNVERIFIED_CONTAM: hypothetical protein FKN15_016743 [Acipenser sinensis]